MSRAQSWIRSLTELPVSTHWAAVTIGSFDGVHRGHASLIERLAATAQPHDGEVVVVTFHPHPLAVLAPDRAPRLITTAEERARRLHAAGADLVIDLPFDDVRGLSGRAFVETVLLEGLGARFILAGPDLRFGKGRDGSSDLLREMGREHGFEVDVAAVVQSDRERISSTRIRAAVAERGQVAAAAEMLGYPHRVTGRVVHGAKRGREIGFPTANLDPETELLPLPGIYAARAHLQDGRAVAAAVSVGHNPTFGAHALTVEAFLLDFNEDLYDQRLSLDFVSRLRGEVAFDSVDALVEQMNRDVAATRDQVDLSV